MKAATIGVVSIGQDSLFFTGRYFREILTAASQAVVSHDCHMRLLTLTPEQVRTPADARALLEAQHVDAALLVAPSGEWLETLQGPLQPIPNVIISAPQLNIPFSYVNSDNYNIMRQIVQHLADQGRKRIRLIQPDGLLTGDYEERARGYRDAVTELGMPPQIGARPHPISDAAIRNQILVGTPDALITPNDSDALAIISRLQRRELQVPRDIAVVGFDDEDFATDTFPTLTTVCQPLAEMARHAISYLFDELDGQTHTLHQEVLPNQLIVRESSGVAVAAR